MEDHVTRSHFAHCPMTREYPLLSFLDIRHIICTFIRLSVLLDTNLEDEYTYEYLGVPNSGTSTCVSSRSTTSYLRIFISMSSRICEIKENMTALQKTTNERLETIEIQN